MTDQLNIIRESLADVGSFVCMPLLTNQRHKIRQRYTRKDRSFHYKACLFLALNAECSSRIHAS